MIKLANFTLIFVILFAEFFKKKFFKFKKNCDDLKKKPSYHNLLIKFSENRNLRIINFFFHNKIFDCFVCCSLLKKIYYNNPNYKFLIGIKIDEDKKLKSHAWIELKNKVFFAILDDIKKYKVVLEVA